MDVYTEFQKVDAIAIKRNLTHEQVYQLPYDDAMQTLGYLHHLARVEHEYHEIKKHKD